MFSETHPLPALWDAVKQAYTLDIDTVSLLDNVAKEPGKYPQSALQDGVLTFKG